MTLADRYPTEKARCCVCGRAIYNTVKRTASGPACVFCQHDQDVADAEAERTRHAAARAAQDTSTSRRDFEARAYQREDAKDGEKLPDDLDFDAIQREMWGPFEDDAPEVGEWFDDLDGWEDE